MLALKGLHASGSQRALRLPRPARAWTARLLGDAGEIAARNSSARLIKILRESRAELAPWKDSGAVRVLDDRLAFYGVA